MNLPRLYPAIAIVSGLLVILAGLSLPTLILNKIERRFEEEMPVLNGSKLEKKWTNPSADIYVRFYLFNLTNPDGIVEGAEKPVLKELGPYTFATVRKNKINGWLDNNKYFEYETYKEYHFDQSMSAGSLSDTIVTLNIPNVVLVQRAKTMWSLAKSAIGSKMKQYNESLIVTTSIREFIFDGYATPTVHVLGKVKKTISGDLIVKEKFALLLGQNGSSSSGVMTAHTGKGDLKKIFSIVRWNGKSSMDCWQSGKSCQMINGSDGSYFPPLTGKEDTLYIFSSEFNRSLHVKFHEESEYYGLKTFVFKAPRDLFMSTSPSGKCFCPNNDTDITESGFCSLHGIIDLSPCQQENVPLVLSAPHFLNGHPLLINSVVGLKPDPIFHESTIEIEPITGTPMKVKKRIQISINVKSQHPIRNLPRYADMIFPIFWLEESVEVDPRIAREIDELIFAKLRLFKYLSIFLLFGGTLSTTLAIIVFFNQLFPSYKRKVKTLADDKQVEENSLKLIKN